MGQIQNLKYNILSKLSRIFSPLLFIVTRLWKKLEGWRSIIGLILIIVDDKTHFAENLGVGAYIFYIIVLAWTGVGLTAKAKKKGII